jgi:hypothetical protein
MHLENVCSETRVRQRDRQTGITFRKLLDILFFEGDENVGLALELTVFGVLLNVASLGLLPERALWLS